MNRCWLNLKIFVALSLIIFSKDLQFSRQWDIFFLERYLSKVYSIYFFFTNVQNIGTKILKSGTRK